MWYIYICIYTYRVSGVRDEGMEFWVQEICFEVQDSSGFKA